MPRGLAERAREIADGLLPAVPRDAATVILLRQEPCGVEAYLLRRTAELEFAPGACVFPGGSVDARDADPASGGPDPARRIGPPCATSAGTRPGPGVRGGQGNVRGVGRAAGRAVAGRLWCSDSAALAADRHGLLEGIGVVRASCSAAGA